MDTKTEIRRTLEEIAREHGEAALQEILDYIRAMKTENSVFTTMTADQLTAALKAWGLTHAQDTLTGSQSTVDGDAR